jgi:hypothetical protein
MLYTELPVFKLAYDLNVELYQIIKKFDREYKYTLGENIKKLSLGLILNIYRANRDKATKVHFILKSREEIEACIMFLKIKAYLLATLPRNYFQIYI